MKVSQHEVFVKNSSKDRERDILAMGDFEADLFDSFAPSN